MKASHLVVLGTARASAVIGTVRALQDRATTVTVLVPRRDEAAVLLAHHPVQCFVGRIGLRSIGLLRTLRRIRPTGIVVVIGDQFVHRNVIAALNWWSTLGLLGRCDLYISASTQPAVLEGFNESDPPERLTAAGFFLLAGLLALWRPSIAIPVLGFLAALELIGRAMWRHSPVRLVPPSAWPILIDDPHLGWTLRPAAVTVLASSPDGTRHTTRITVSPDGARPDESATHDPTRPGVVLYGGSYLFGEACSDDDTVVSQLARVRPDRRLSSRAVPGYGAAQAARRALLDLDKERPAAVVLVFAQGDATAEAGVRSWMTAWPRGSRSRFPMAERLFLCRIGSASTVRLSESLERRTALRRLRERCAFLGVPLALVVCGPDHAGLAAVASRLGIGAFTISEAGDVPAQLDQALADVLQRGHTC